MCGISTVIDFEAGLPHHETMLRMHEEIPHRGRDGEGFLCVDTTYRPFTTRHVEAIKNASCAEAWRLVMGFRWLKIQDHTDLAAQPMSSRDGTVWLLLNGEIYNFAELRRELFCLGFHFVTQSDTEVVVAAYQAWGNACFARFRGMWAMVIVDLRQRKVIISRDRFGIKPLFYHLTGSRLLLASEIKQIVAVFDAHVQVNLALVCNFLHGGRLHHDEATFFADVFAMPPATYAVIKLQEPCPSVLNFQPYWNLDDFSCPDPSQTVSFVDACSGLDELLHASVSEHLAAQVPVGSLLSGGLDSSTLTALAAELSVQAGREIPSFSLVSPGYPELDESPYINTVVKHRGLRNFTTALDVTWVNEHIRHISWTQEEPLIGPPWIAQYRIYQLAAEHGMRVVLDGQGADELMAGYPRHQYVLLRDWLSRLRLLDLGRETVALLKTDPNVLVGIARHAWQGYLQRCVSRHTTRRRYNCLSIDGKLFLEQNSPTRPVNQSSSDPSILNRMLSVDVQSGNLKTVLAVGDRNAMAHTIESRVPYLDHRIVEFVFQLPASYKVAAGVRKRILRQVASRYLPDAVVYRTDPIGFGTPQWQWLKTHFRNELLEAMHSEMFRHAALFDRRGLLTCVNDFYAGRHQHADVIWRIYALWQWAEAYRVTFA